MIPLWSVPRSTSSSARIIPSDTSPRSLRRSSVSPFGSVAPGSATATFAPGAEVPGAADDLSTAGPPPRRPDVSCSRSAFGCFSASSTWPTRKSPRSPGTPTRCTPLTSAVEIESASAISCVARVDAHVLAQPAERDLHRNCLRKRRSFSQNGRMPGDAVAELRGALDAHPEREARVLLRVPADELVEVRIDHPRAAHLDPAGVLADRAAGAAADEARDVRLHRRLGEREVVRAEAHLALGPVQLAHHVEQRPLEVGHRDPLVDREALELVEDREVRRVDRVAPVDAADRDHVDRRPLLLHLVDLRRRRLGAQQRVCRRGRARRAASATDASRGSRARRSCSASSRPRGRRRSRSRGRGRCPRRRGAPASTGGASRAGAAAAARAARAGSVTSTRSVASLSSSSARSSSRLPGGERRLDRLAHGVERHAGLAVAHLAQRELQGAATAEVANARPRRARRATPPRQRRRAPPSRGRRDPRRRPYPTISPPFAGTGTSGDSGPGSSCGGTDAASAPTPRRRAGAA